VPVGRAGSAFGTVKPSPLLAIVGRFPQGSKRIENLRPWSQRPLHVGVFNSNAPEDVDGFMGGEGCGLQPAWHTTSCTHFIS
jgi:hypothetical protein